MCVDKAILRLCPADIPYPPGHGAEPRASSTFSLLTRPAVLCVGLSAGLSTQNAPRHRETIPKPVSPAGRRGLSAPRVILLSVLSALPALGTELDGAPELQGLMDKARATARGSCT